MPYIPPFMWYLDFHPWLTLRPPGQSHIERWSYCLQLWKNTLTEEVDHYSWQLDDQSSPHCSCISIPTYPTINNFGLWSTYPSISFSTQQLYVILKSKNPFTLVFNMLGEQFLLPSNIYLAYIPWGFLRGSHFHHHNALRSPHEYCKARGLLSSRQ